ncbi:MAG TPA: MaoC family dehydratase [Acidimicrobiales bacterium]|nr:MaoC family dehydratase [Acidimicrobiales bacterium]
MSTTVNVDDFHTLTGRHLGYSDWVTVEQERVNQFADATGDHQWIHVDIERANNGPFGGPIAHGYLTLSMIPELLDQVLTVADTTSGVNYGCNRVRFPAPVPVGSQIRLGVAVAAVDPVPGGVQVVLDATVEVGDAAKPSCVAQVIFHYYNQPV